MKTPGQSFFLQSKFNQELVTDISGIINEFKPDLLVLHPTGKSENPHYHMYYHSNQKDQDTRNKRVKKFLQNAPQKWGYTKVMTDLSGSWFQYAVRFGHESIIANKFNAEFTNKMIEQSYKKSSDALATVNGCETVYVLPKKKKIRKKLWTHVYEECNELPDQIITKELVAKAILKVVDRENLLIPRSDIARQIVETVYWHHLEPVKMKPNFENKLIKKWITNDD